MNCSRDEAILVLKKWFHEDANLFLTFQASDNAELVRLAGRILSLDGEKFIFISTACSVSVPFDCAMFQYEEGANDAPLEGQNRPRAARSLRLLLHSEKHLPIKSISTSLASPVLSLTEAIS
jgi:hypothetical protein